MRRSMPRYERPESSPEVSPMPGERRRSTSLRPRRARTEGTGRATATPKVRAFASSDLRSSTLPQPGNHAAFVGEPSRSDAATTPRTMTVVGLRRSSGHDSHVAMTGILLKGYDLPKRQRTAQAGYSSGCQRSKVDPNVPALAFRPELLPLAALPASRFRPALRSHSASPGVTSPPRRQTLHSPAGQPDSPPGSGTGNRDAGGIARKLSHSSLGK